MRFNKLCILIGMLTVSYSFATKSLKYSPMGHYYIGSTLYLPFPDKNNIDSGIKYYSAKTTNIYSVKLSNGKNFDLTYPMLSYLPGIIEDPNVHMYGIKENTRIPLFYLVNNFRKNFNMLTSNFTADDGTVYYVPDWLPKIDAVVKQSYESNIYNIKNKLPIVEYLDQKFNCITGGACSDNILDSLHNQGLSFKIITKDGGHFGEDAIMNYLLGHYVALMYALLATNVEGLKLAYSYEAYAAHYLEDAFVAGNQQMVQIEKIFEYEHSADIDKIYNDKLLSPITKLISKHMFVYLLARLEHNYLNRTGILFERWVDQTPYMSYGDGKLFIPQNEASVENLRDTLQQGILQVYHAYTHYDDHIDFIDDYIGNIVRHVPDLYYITNNNKPMFVIDNNKIYDLVDGIYNPDGSTPMLCLLKNHLDDLLFEETMPAKTKESIKQLLLQQCSQSYMDSIALTTAKVSSSDAHLNTVGSHVYVSATTPTFFDYPILTVNGVTCQFTVPIKFYNYGLLNSLDIADLSGVKNLQYVNTISSDYLTCKGQWWSYFTATYQNSTDKSKRIFTLIKGDSHSNIKVCYDNNGDKFLANKSFDCKFE